MYQYDPNRKTETGAIRGIAYRPETRKFFQARAVGQRAQQPNKFEGQKKSWASTPLSTISRGLDYLYRFNAIDAAESVGGMVKESLTAAKKFAKSPFELHKLVKYNSEVKELNKAKQQGKISEQAYNNRMGTISAEAKRLSQEYDPKTAGADALSASLLIPGAGTGGKLAKGAFSFLKREGVKSLVKPTLAKGAGLGLKSTMRETSRALISRPLSTPLFRGSIEASKKLAKAKAVVDTVPQITGKDFKPIEIMKEGKLKEAVRFGSAMTTPIPYVGKAFKAIGKGKKYVASATEYQAGESAFKKYFGKAMDIKPFQGKDLRAATEAQIIKGMKERGIVVNEKNIISFLKNLRDPKIESLPMVSNSIKRILKANKIEKIDDVKKLTDDMLTGILKDKKDVRAIKEAIEEMGKVEFSGMHFKTKAEQLKAMAVFEYTGVHTGTWKRSAKELRQFIDKTYAKIEKGAGDIKGPEIKTGKLIQIGKQKVIAPPKEHAFTIVKKLQVGKWDDNRAMLGMPKRDWVDAYSQGVRELPKGDASFLAGRKAELGRTLNKMAEGKLGKLLMPQNSREIYSKIRTKLDASLVKAFGKDTGKAEKAIHRELNRPLVDSWNIKIPLYRPSERELGKGAWRRIIHEVTGESLDSDKVRTLARQMNKEMSEAFVTSMKEAGIPTNLIDRMRATSGSFNWIFYNLYTLPRFQLRAGFWMQQVPEVFEWGTARISKLPSGSLIRKAGGKTIKLSRTITRKSDLFPAQKAINEAILGQTEEISGAGVKALMFSRRNETNAYALGVLLESDKALNSMPVVRNYLKKHGLKSAEEIPYLKKMFYAPLADDADELAKIINKYGWGGQKAHLADPTKTVLKQGREAAVFDNAIREALKISKPNAYKEAIPLFLYNPNRSMLEKSLHAWPMFPLSYAIKVAERGGGYILEGKAIRPKIFASIINTMTDFHENEKIEEMEKKYWNLFNAAEGWLPHDPSYDFSTGFLPPFSKMLWRWAENPEYYLDEKDGVERSMKVLWPAYREAKGWEQCYDNITRIHKKVRKGGTMTEEEANKIIEGFRFKEPTKIEKVKLPKLPAKPKEKGKGKDYRTTQEKRFAEKKARRGKLLEVKPEKKKEDKNFVPKITVPKTFKPKPPVTRPPYSNP